MTICTWRGMQVFGEVKDSHMVLSCQGEIAYAQWLTPPTRFPGIELDHFVVMPNHVHGIIVRTERLASESQTSKHELAKPEHMNKMQVYRTSPYRRQMLCELIRTYKGVTSYYVRRSDEEKRGFGWHRDYFEHVIRNAKELDALRTYIINNPMKWQEDKLHPSSNWKLR